MTQEFNKPVGQAIQAENAEIYSQQFHGAVGNVAAGDIINNAAPPPSRLLTDPEKNVLKRLVWSLENEFGQNGGKVWNDLHEALGTGGLAKMQVEHFRPAKAFLELMVENAELRAADGDAGDLVGEVQRLRQQLNESAAAMTKLTERNAKLGADLKQAQAARTSSDSGLAKALQQLDMLRGQSQSIERITAERDRAAGSARDLRQQVSQLEANLQGASRRLGATRRKVAITSLGFAATALASSYLGYRLLTVEGSTSKPVQQLATAPAHREERENSRAPLHSVLVRHHVTPHHSSMRQLPPLPGQMSMPADSQSADAEPAPGYIQQSDSN
ncbi:hypothetical protein J4G52_25175 [Burkholderia cenocepacia]|uniref:hypothetical protein n=1 Tax=Burkholderia cenocepacia TaxID=95486 RepID=UPI001AA14629|nr:hypothetical protein [Burkholderia cenocepacia]MBO1856835.1 hypothetical protein [Burkholderia cenocepacia]